MTIADLELRLGCTPLIPYQDGPLAAAYTSDLLSDVMAHAPEDGVLITLQGHKNTVACASLAGLKAIVLAGLRDAPADMLEAARTEGIAVFGSPLRQFELSWKVAFLLGLVQP
jgi:hypothetical protein